MRSKLVIRTIVALNTAFWVIALSFPFARLFSVATMHRLSYLFADLSVLFPLTLAVLLIVVFWRYRRHFSVVRYDVLVALFAVLLDALLIRQV
jgi:uncharacterized membrane protein YqjE